MEHADYFELLGSHVTMLYRPYTPGDHVLSGKSTRVARVHEVPKGNPM